jgi:aminoglycoside 6-adenylyltransferase
MRSEQEMLDLILDIARDDEHIRAVILNGSRANPNAPRDFFQDFDIVYLVTEVSPFVKNLAWIRRFGELMILQMPEDMHDPPSSADGGFSYLMQFSDGNRIDLGIYPLSKLDEVTRDRLSVLLLDKDGIAPLLAPPDERAYLPKPPSAKAFADCCNEFWWVCPYIAKGLWRDEIVYAKYMLDQVLREQLMKMLVWLIGVQTDFSQDPGKFGKYFQRYLAPELWDLLLQTYADADDQRTWEALFAMGELFRRAALRVADHFGYDYPQGDDQKVSAHLRHVRTLPRDAAEMYA